MTRELDICVYKDVRIKKRRDLLLKIKKMNHIILCFSVLILKKSCCNKVAFR